MRAASSYSLGSRWAMAQFESKAAGIYFEIRPGPEETQARVGIRLGAPGHVYNRLPELSGGCPSG